MLPQNSTTTMFDEAVILEMSHIRDFNHIIKSIDSECHF